MISALEYLRNRDIQGQYLLLTEQYGNDPAPRYSPTLRGLSPKSILTFNVVEISTPDVGRYECSVCLYEMQPREKARLMPCGHRFHLLCIDT